MRRLLVALALIIGPWPTAARATVIGDAHRAIAARQLGTYRIVACARVTRTVVDCRVLVLTTPAPVCQPGTMPTPLSVAVCETPQPTWTELVLRVHRGNVWIRP